jgi:hypothetical protein
VHADHVAYTYASLSDLFDNYGELRAKGIGPYWCIHHGSVEYDPDEWLAEVRSGTPVEYLLVSH